MVQHHPLKRLRKYPHLSPQDRSLWERWLDTSHEDFTSVQYDIHVGPGIEVPDHYPDNIANMATALTQYRIDAVIHSAQVIYIVEIKPAADITAFGQALGYSWLYKQDFPTSLRVQPTVLTETIKPGVAGLYRAHDVAIWLLSHSSAV